MDYDALFAIIVGFILDLLIGDPRWLPHPIVNWKFDKLFRKAATQYFWKKLAWLIGRRRCISNISACFFVLCSILVLALAEKINPWLAFAVESFMCYQIFATRCLREESMKVYTALKNNDLTDARMKLSWIVGRDTKELTKSEVTKGAVETVAENTADGIIAPMLYMFIGGAPLAFLYKGINTMDSMVGYKNDKYLYFGRCAAKLDDFANYIPARVAGICMIVAAYLLSLDAKKAWKIFKRDRYNHLSPNSAMTESVTAGALHIQLGGGHFYFGKWVPKDTIGDDIRQVEPEDIVQTNNLMYMTAVLSILVFALIYLLELFIKS